MSLRLKHEQRLGASLTLAIALHTVVFFIQLDRDADPTLPAALISVGILKEPAELKPVQLSPVELSPVQPNQLEPIKADEPSTDLTPEKKPQVISESTSALKPQALFQPARVDAKTLDSKIIITIPSIHSDEFKRFVDRETKTAINNDASELTGFEQSFIRPVTPQIQDTKPESDPLLGGGNYKIRRNGIECESLTMVPQTFDELTGAAPIIKGGGRCKNLNKKIKLTDKDGKIQNTDRIDWP